MAAAGGGSLEIKNYTSYFKIINTVLEKGKTEFSYGKDVESKITSIIRDNPDLKAELG
jgi:hypothetical protein